MHNYECGTCGQLFEIEEYEAQVCPPEHYEHGQCITCFEKDIEKED